MKQLSTLDRNKIKELIHEKKQAYKSYRQNKKNNTFCLHQFELFHSKLNSLIEKSKLIYYTRVNKNHQIPRPVRNSTGLY